MKFWDFLFNFEGVRSSDTVKKNQTKCMFVELQVYFPLDVCASAWLLSVYFYHLYFLISVVCMTLFIFEIVFCIEMHSIKQCTSPYNASCLDSGSVILEHQIIFLYSVPPFMVNHYCLKNHPKSLCSLIFQEYVCHFLFSCTYFHFSRMPL